MNEPGLAGNAFAQMRAHLRSAAFPDTLYGIELLVAELSVGYIWKELLEYILYGGIAHSLYPPVIIDLSCERLSKGLLTPIMDLFDT